MLRIGNITEIDVNKCYARVTFLDDGIVSDWLQICVMGALSNKFFHMFDINEQVACLMDEHSDDGVILGALFNDKTLPVGGNKDVVRVRFSDESFIEYNRASHEYNINIQGNVNIISSGDTTVETAGNTVVIAAGAFDITAPNVNITGAMTVSGAISAASISAPIIGGAGVSMEDGNLTADGNISGATVTAGTIDLGTHVHAGVQTGGNSTAPPTP